VAEGDALPPDVADHEPAEALFAGADGLAVIRRLVARSAEAGVARLAMEVGAGQADAVAALASGAAFARVSTRRDLAGIERVVVAET